MNDEKVGSVSNYERRVIKAMESRPELAPVLGSVRKDYSFKKLLMQPILMVVIMKMKIR